MFSLSTFSPFRALTLLSALTTLATANPVPVPEAKDTTPNLQARAFPPWVARHGLTSAGYQSTFDTLVSQGYHLTYASGYTSNNDPRFAAIWEKSATSAWVARHGMTSAQYQAAFNTYTSQGYRPRLVNGYTVSNSGRFVAYWDKSPSPAGGWVARHDMTSAGYQAEFNNWVGKGFRLTHVSGYQDGGVAKYAALWEKPAVAGPAWVARHGMTSAQYQSAFNGYVAQGYRLVLVSGYVVNGVDYYAAIWEKSSTPTGAWVARHGLTSAQYQAEFDKWVGQGYKLTVVSGYTLSGNQDRYAAIWIK